MVVAPVVLASLQTYNTAPRCNISFSAYYSLDQLQKLTNVFTHPECVHSTRKESSVRTVVPLLVYCAAYCTTACVFVPYGACPPPSSSRCQTVYCFLHFLFSACCHSLFAHVKSFIFLPITYPPVKTLSQC
jgi:hypothetical protein